MSQETDLRNELHKFILLHYSRIWLISIVKETLLFKNIFINILIFNMLSLESQRRV